MNTINNINDIVRMRDFDIHKCFTCCDRCGEPNVSAVTHIPVLSVWVCWRCYWKWDRWGLWMFKEMINFE